MWSLSGIIWGGLLGGLVGLMAAMPRYIESTRTTDPEPAKQFLMIVECITIAFPYALAGLILGTAAGAVAGAVIKPSEARPAQYFSTAVLGASISALLSAIVLGPYWNYAILFAAIGAAAGLLAAASIRTIAVRASRSDSAPADQPEDAPG